VTVDGEPGQVLDRDDGYSDGCFIGLNHLSRFTRRTSGPLRLAPRQHEAVSFEGAQSGSVNTRIIAWSYELPYLDPNLTPVVRTEPVTASGDSGAALIDSQNAVVGFSFSRSDLRQPVQYSAWIWADAVFEKLGLTTYEGD
jgi:hypothetical protein